MSSFVGSVVLAGAMVFLAGIAAAIANRARMMGARPLWTRTAFATALAALLAAITVAASGISSLPDDDSPPEAPEGTTSPRDFMENLQ